MWVCVIFLLPFMLLLLLSHTHTSYAGNCVLQHTCRYIWQLLVDAGKQTLRCACTWSSVGEFSLTPAACKLPTHLSPNWNVRQKGQRGIRRAINCTVYRFVTVDGKPERLKIEGEERFTGNELLILKVRVCVCVWDPQLEIGCGFDSFDSNKGNVSVEKCLLLVVNDSN